MAFSHDDTRKVGEALNALAMNFNSEIKPELFAIWLAKLSEFPANVVLMAVSNVMDTYEFKTLPPYAILRNEVLKLMGRVEKPEDKTAKAQAEWDILVRKIERIGSYGEPGELHETTDYVLRAMGGWSVLCSSLTQANMPFMAKDFVTRWVQADGKVEAMEGGALALEELTARNARIARGEELPPSIGPSNCDAIEDAEIIEVKPVERPAPVSREVLDLSKAGFRLEDFVQEVDQSNQDWWHEVEGAENEHHARCLMWRRAYQARNAALRSQGM